jgi:hypothetical protein
MNEAGNGPAAVLSNPDHESEMVRITMGNQDPLNIRSVVPCLPKLILDELKSPGDFRGGISQGNRV